MDWLLHVVYDGAVTVIQEFNVSLVPHSGYQIHLPYWLPLQSEPQPKSHETVKHYTSRKIK